MVIAQSDGRRQFGISRNALRTGQKARIFNILDVIHDAIGLVLVFRVPDIARLEALRADDLLPDQN